MLGAAPVLLAPTSPRVCLHETRRRVDYARRDKIMPNHTFTHVLNYALRKVGAWQAGNPLWAAAAAGVYPSLPCCASK